MPTSDGNFKGISVPAIPWHAEYCYACGLRMPDGRVQVTFEDGDTAVLCGQCSEDIT